MRHLERDGVTLCYEEAGEPPILLAHGWCCDHTYLAPQFEHFAIVSPHHQTTSLLCIRRVRTPHALD